LCTTQHIDLLLPFAVTDLPEVAADAHAGVVDEDVETGNETERRLGQAVRLAHAREVGRNTPGLDAEGAHCGDGLLDRFRVATGDDDVGAVTR
jgi:hypothetical protein